MIEIDKNNPNHIFVFGSNTEGRHGKGAALFARKEFKAIYGQPKGLQGNAYGIITKNLNFRLGVSGYKSISLQIIKEQLIDLSEFASQNSHLTFFISKIGTNNAGYTNKEIETIMNEVKFPDNCVLPNWN